MRVRVCLRVLRFILFRNRSLISFLFSKLAGAGDHLRLIEDLLIGCTFRSGSPSLRHRASCCRTATN